MKKKRSASSRQRKLRQKSLTHTPDSKLDLSDVPEATDERPCARHSQLATGATIEGMGKFRSGVPDLVQITNTCEISAGERLARYE